MIENKDETKLFSSKNVFFSKTFSKKHSGLLPVPSHPGVNVIKLFTAVIYEFL